LTILLTPGPGIPDEAGLLKAVIQKYGLRKASLVFVLDNKQ
jgi:anthranilate synthase component 2